MRIKNKKLPVSFPKYRSGFGILEVLISSVIIMIILSALVFIGNAALTNSQYVQQRAQAIFLAQESIEQVRQMRDTNWIDGNNATQWNSLVWSTDASPVLLTVTDPASPLNYVPVVVGTRYGLKSFSDATDQEKKITQNNTEYTRAVVVSTTDGLLMDNSSDVSINRASNSLKITANVSWNSKTGNKTVTSSEILTNWRPNY